MVDPVSFEMLPESELWDKLTKRERLIFFDIEITARCNNDCTHCYINLPAGDHEAKKKELSLKQICDIADQAVEMGALWCLITGGEPLLREDFVDIYMALRKKGLLTSVFTNACLVTEEHADLFWKYPPRDIEVTVYGVTKSTYEKISRRPGSFEAFMCGLDILLSRGIQVRFKTMALRSNLNELPQIAEFCRQRTKDYFRFDPQLHLRFDRDDRRNELIRSERLTPEQVVAVEKADAERFGVLKKNCDQLIDQNFEHCEDNHLFRCGAGLGNFSVSYDGFFRLCSSLWHPDCVYDLKRGTLKEAWYEFVPKVRDMRSDNRGFLEKCSKCSIINLCSWCPANAYLETGRLDLPVEFFCDIAKAREKLLIQ